MAKYIIMSLLFTRITFRKGSSLAPISRSQSCRVARFCAYSDTHEALPPPRNPSIMHQTCRRYSSDLESEKTARISAYTY